MDFFSSYLKVFAKHYPETSTTIDVRNKLSPLLFCPHIIPIPKTLKHQAEEFARALFQVRKLENRTKALESLNPTLNDPGNNSVLMSYDFHIDSQNQLRLIEINTNASMSLMSDMLYETQQISNGFNDNFRSEIISAFKNEYRLYQAKCGHSETDSSLKIAIVDEAPDQQKLFVEFNAYRELFAQNGFFAQIADTRDLKFTNGSLKLGEQSIDLVYNRDTDFYFQKAENSELRQAMESGSVCLSPHPHEYRILADKERLVELSTASTMDSLEVSDEDKKIIRSALLISEEVSRHSDPDKLWAHRKKLFFKPKRSFGGKAVYRGASISHPIFSQILAGDYLCQEYVPPSTIQLANVNSGELEEFKYDLRFFVYQDKVQLACARLYRGQMTNSQTPGGGVAAINWV
jgi:DNA primase large subunit